MFETIAWISIIIGFVLIISISLAAMLITRRREQNAPKAVDFEEAVRKVDAAADAALNEINKTAELILKDVDEKYQTLLFLYDLLEDKQKEMAAQASKAAPASMAAQASKAAQTSMAAPVSITTPNAVPQMPARRIKGQKPVTASYLVPDSVPADASRSFPDSVHATASNSLPDSVPAASSFPVQSSASAPVKPYTLNARYERIIALLNDGLTPPDIAKEMNIGQGEVQLVIGLMQKK